MVTFAPEFLPVLWLELMALVAGDYQGYDPPLERLVIRDLVSLLAYREVKTPS